VTRLRYFAWLRERIGVADEEIAIPDGVETVAGLIAHLAARDDGYAAAFAEPAIVRAAIDHEHVEQDAPIGSAREIAFFPPMTGG